MSLQEEIMLRVEMVCPDRKSPNSQVWWLGDSSYSVNPGPACLTHRDRRCSRGDKPIFCIDPGQSKSGPLSVSSMGNVVGRLHGRAARYGNNGSERE